MKPFNPEEDTQKTRRKLPHWEQNGCTYFLTFRLADSLAQTQLMQWQEELRIWNELNPPPWTATTQSDYHRRFTARMQEWLDRGSGSCALARPELREIVVGSLRQFDGDRYHLDSFVVMPNHVHVLLTPIEQWSLARIRHSWKSYTAKEINRLLGTRGKFWHDEGFDHIVRDAHHLERFRRYMMENPAKAGLDKDAYHLWP